MDAFIGEIRPFPFGFVPQGWYACNGQELSAPGNPALYSIIGNTWGGTPNQSFKLPNLAGLTVMCQGTGTGLTPRHWGATTVGTKSVAISNQTMMGAHTHAMTIQAPFQATVQASTQSAPTASQSWLARTVTVTAASKFTGVVTYTKYTGQQPDIYLHPASVTYMGGNSGGSADPHENRQPYLTLVYCINNDGIYPVRN